jgi:hypothetical protein
MQYLTAITAAIKGKAPIVAVPVEGRAPVCVKRKLLADWSKKVTITRIEVQQAAPYVELRAPRYYSGPGTPVGPHERIETPAPRRLVIEGTSGRVKCRCSLIPIDRRTAVKELSAWSEKERAKLEKKRLLGALSTDERKRLKRAKFEGRTPDMVEVYARYLDVRRPHHGYPVKLAPFPEVDFVVHRNYPDSKSVVLMEDKWSVTEPATGFSAGYGVSAEDAIVDARRKVAKVTPERIAAIRQQIEEATRPTA